MPSSVGRSYDSLAIDTSNYIIAVCFTQRRIQFLEAFRLAERLCKRLSYFTDGSLETYAHCPSFFPILSWLISKNKPKPEILLCLVYDVRQCTVKYVYTYRHICVCIKKPIWMIYIYVSPCSYSLGSTTLGSVQLHNIWSFVTIISHFKVFKCSFGKGKCLV